MDQLEQKITEVIAQLQAISPDVAQAALGAARISAVQTLVTGFVALSVAAAATYASYRLARLYYRMQEADAYADENLTPVVAAFATGGLGIITAITAISCLTSVWAWVGLSNPEYVLAAKALGLW